MHPGGVRTATDLFFFEKNTFTKHPIAHCTVYSATAQCSLIVEAVNPSGLPAVT